MRMRHDSDTCNDGCRSFSEAGDNDFSLFDIIRLSPASLPALFIFFGMPVWHTPRGAFSVLASIDGSCNKRKKETRKQ